MFLCYCFDVTLELWYVDKKRLVCMVVLVCKEEHCSRLHKIGMRAGCFHSIRSRPEFYQIKQIYIPRFISKPMTSATEWTHWAYLLPTSWNIKSTWKSFHLTWRQFSCLFNVSLYPFSYALGFHQGVLSTHHVAVTFSDSTKYFDHFRKEQWK